MNEIVTLMEMENVSQYLIGKTNGETCFNQYGA